LPRNDERRDIVTKKLVGVSGGELWRGKGKSRLINMARNDDAMSSKIHTLITLMVRRIARKDACTRPWYEFVGAWLRRCWEDNQKREVTSSQGGCYEAKNI
jgi:hypothetical protein